jgi:hypothetical protein
MQNLYYLPLYSYTDRKVMKIINKLLILLLFSIIISIAMVESIVFAIPNSIDPPDLVGRLGGNNLTADLTSDLNFHIGGNNLTADLTSVDSSDINDPAFPPLNTEKIAREISMLDATELKTYNITYLSNQEIMLVFQHLPPLDLLRVLMSIPLEDLQEIKNRLTPSKFNQILDMVGANRIQVENRLSPAIVRSPATVGPAIILP